MNELNEYLLNENNEWNNELSVCLFWQEYVPMAEHMSCFYQTIIDFNNTKDCLLGNNEVC